MRQSKTLRPNLPIDLYLRYFFLDRKNDFTPEQRAFIVQHTYSLIRHKTYLGFLGDKPINWINRLRVYEGNQFQYREKTPIKEEEQMPDHVKVSCPKELYELLRAAHGPETAMKIAKIQLEEPRMTVRANTLRTTRKDLMREFKALGYNVRATEHAPNGIRFLEPPTGNLFAMA